MTTRRQLLSNLWRGGLVLVAGAGLWTTWDLLKPGAARGFGGEVRTVPPESVPETGVIEVPAARSYLVRIDGELLALSQKCTHLGCRVPFCESSGQFECPCHGSVFNRAGELRSGPAPRGMDQHPTEVGADGLVYIDTGTLEEGPAAGNRDDRRTGDRAVVRHGGGVMYNDPTDEDIERSTNNFMVAGVVLLGLMALVFPLYRYYEPSARDEARTSQEASLAEEGENLWEFNCASCHGLAGEGAVGPALNSTQFLQSATDEQGRTLIAVGVPGSQMSAYSLDYGGPLTSEQIRAVMTYIRSWEPDAPDRPDWRDMVDG